MKIFSKISTVVLVVVFVFGLIGSTTVLAATSPSLGAAGTFSVLAQTGITGTVTTITGDVENNGTGAAITALTTAMVGGTIYSSDAVATLGAPPAPTTLLNAAVQANTLTAFGALDAATNADANCIKPSTGLPGIDADGTDLGGLSLPPGLYCSAGTFGLTGNLTLTGTTGTWVFKTVTAINTAVGSSITGGDPCNVWWRVGSLATLGNSSSFIGTIISGTGVHFGTGVTLNGRALAKGGDVTFAGTDSITGPTCTITPSVGGGSQNVPSVYPLINVTKIPSPLNLPAGPGSVTYTYMVTNIGVVAVTDVSVNDNKCSPVSFIDGDDNNDSILDLDEEWVYKCTKVVAETETDTVTACGKARNISSSASICDTANATVVVGKSIIPPLIHIVKRPNIFILPVGGGAVTYSYIVTNPGTAPLSNVKVTDDKCTGLPGRVIGHPGDLNKNNLLENNETWSFICQTNINQTTSNIGMAEGSANGLIATDFSPAIVTVLSPGLPNTGVSTDNIIYILSGLLALSLIALILALRKKMM